MGAAREHVERGIELYNNRQFDEMAARIAPDAVGITPYGTAKGPEAIVGVDRRYHEAFPDRLLEPVNWVEQGDTVAVEYEITATHTKSVTTMEGTVVRPTHRPVRFPGLSIYEVRDGLVTKAHGYWDRATVLSQIGVLSFPEGPARYAEPPTATAGQSRPAAERMAPGAAREHCQRIVELHNKGDVEGIVAMYAPEGVWITPWRTCTGREAIAEGLRDGHTAFPDEHIDPLSWVLEGDTVVLEYEWTGMHDGPLRAPDGTSIAATGRPVRLPTASIFDIRDGQTTLHRLYADEMAVLLQLGFSV